MTTVILVEGTWGGEWARARSPFSCMLRAHEFAPMRLQGWSKNLDGVPNLLEHGQHRDWIAGGYALAYFLRGLDGADRNIICHSHGIAPVLYAAVRENVQIRRLISVCSPVRQDLQRQATVAAHRIGRWRHISSNNGDPWQLLGELFDGHVGLGERKWMQADENLVIPGIGHAGLLNDPTFLDLWQTDGMLDFLRAEPLLDPHDGGVAVQVHF